MKIFITALCILGLCINVLAAEDIVLNDQIMSKFIIIFAQYKKMATKYGENINNINAVPASMDFQNERDQLLKTQGWTMEEFSLLIQKIATGMTVIKLRENELPDMFAGLQQLSTASEEELAVIEKNLAQLEMLFR